MEIAALDDRQDAVRRLDCFNLLQDHEVKAFNNTVRGVGQLAARVADVGAIVLIRECTRVTCQLLDRLPELEIISQTGRASCDSGGHIDLDACTDKGVVVLEGKGSPAAPVKLAWTLVMAAQHRIPQYAVSPKHSAWQQSELESTTMPPNSGIGRILKDQTLDTFGYGEIGWLAVGYGRAFGMNVLMWGRESSQERARADGFAVVNSGDALFEQSDMLSTRLRLNDKTCGIATVADLVRMKPTALLVSTSRAELVEENGLVTSLNRRRPDIATIDVFETEPILQDHILLRMENCICTSHIDYIEHEGYELYFGVAFQNILDVLQGNVDSMVNPTALASALIRV